MLEGVCQWNTQARKYCEEINATETERRTFRAKKEEKNIVLVLIQQATEDISNKRDFFFRTVSWFTTWITNRSRLVRCIWKINRLFGMSRHQTSSMLTPLVLYLEEAVTAGASPCFTWDQNRKQVKWLEEELKELGRVLRKGTQPRANSKKKGNSFFPPPLLWSADEW